MPSQKNLGRLDKDGDSDRRAAQTADMQKMLKKKKRKGGSSKKKKKKEGHKGKEGKRR